MAAVPSTGRASGVEPAAAPEADAARALYERYAGQLYGFCLNRLGSREEAEDAVQTTFLNAFRGLQRGVVPDVEAAWLFKIAENVCLTRHRSAWRRGRVESPSDMQALQDVTPARQAGGGEELIPLGEALAAMPETQRRAILLREWQGLSYREIAADLDMSQSAVETLIFRARRSLANALETPWGERRAAGRRALDLGSALASLKALFAGASVAKVAAVVAVAATGTTALAVADRHHPAPPARVEPSVAAARAPDSAARRPVVVPSARVAPVVSSAGGVPTGRHLQAAVTERASASKRRVAQKPKAETSAAAPAEAKTPPGQAKERGAPARADARAARAAAPAKTKAKPKVTREVKPKVKAKTRPKRKPVAKSAAAPPAPKPKADAPTSEAPQPTPPPAPAPTPPADAFAPAPATPPPPPEKEKAKGSGDSAQGKG